MFLTWLILLLLAGTIQVALVLDSGLKLLERQTWGLGFGHTLT
jgi:hypothetical protein